MCRIPRRVNRVYSQLLKMVRKLKFDSDISTSNGMERTDRIPLGQDCSLLLMVKILDLLVEVDQEWRWRGGG